MSKKEKKHEQEKWDDFIEFIHQNEISQRKTQ